MAAKNLLEMIKNGRLPSQNGVNALLSECSNRDMVKALKKASGGLNARIRFYENEGETVAVLDYSGECEECDISKRVLKTGPLTEVSAVDFGMALLLRDDQYTYLLNLETPLTL